MAKRDRIETPVSFCLVKNMNKRQAKKREKQIERQEGRKDLPFFDADIDRNGEGYHDPTASAALRNVLRDEH